MKEILLRRRETLRQENVYVFHRNGRRIKDFREEWSKATVAAKLTGLLVHDLCRSCAVNLCRSGVAETVASKYMNRKTLAIFINNTGSLTSWTPNLLAPHLKNTWNLRKLGRKLLT